MQPYFAKVSIWTGFEPVSDSRPYRNFGKIWLHRSFVICGLDQNMVTKKSVEDLRKNLVQ